MDLFDLEEGDYFIWVKQPFTVYRLKDEDDGTGRCSAISVYSNHEEYGWKLTKATQLENFNSYAEVKKVRPEVRIMICPAKQ